MPLPVRGVRQGGENTRVRTRPYRPERCAWLIQGEQAGTRQRCAKVTAAKNVMVNRMRNMNCQCPFILRCVLQKSIGQRTRPYDRAGKEPARYTKRPSAPASHETRCRPLLPSGPGGVEQCLVAQDLTSKHRNEFNQKLPKYLGHCLPEKPFYLSHPRVPSASHPPGTIAFQLTKCSLMFGLRTPHNPCAHPKSVLPPNLMCTGSDSGADRDLRLRRLRL